MVCQRPHVCNAALSNLRLKNTRFLFGVIVNATLLKVFDNAYSILIDSISFESINARLVRSFGFGSFRISKLPDPIRRQLWQRHAGLEIIAGYGRRDGVRNLKGALLDYVHL